MFAARCGTCGRRVLLSVSEISSMRNVGGAMEVGFTCQCGADGVWQATRKAA